MTGSEWATSTDPMAMLRALRPEWDKGEEYYAVSDRKLRLFACAVARQVWGRLTDGRGRRAVEVAERFADGLATLGELQEAAAPLDNLVENDLWTADDLAANAAETTVPTSELAVDAVEICEWAERLGPSPLLSRAALAALLRDIVGNPWRPVAFLKPGDKLKMLTVPRYRLVPAGEGDRVAATVLSISGGRMRVQPSYSDLLTPATPGVWELWRPDWITPQALSLARLAHDERPGRACDKCEAGKIRIGFGGRHGYGPPIDCPVCRGTGRIDDGTLDPFTLAAVADALEEAGCVDQCEDCGGTRTRCEHTLCVKCGGWIKPHPLLAHLRSPEPHVRGCWAVDLTLDKE